jgi:hypothetical protein
MLVTARAIGSEFLSPRAREALRKTRRRADPPHPKSPREGWIGHQTNYRRSYAQSSTTGFA